MKPDCVNHYRDQLLQALGLDRSFISAKGDWLFDEQGNRVYDALSQYGVQIFGHNNEEVVTKAARYLQGHNPNFIQPLFAASTRKLARKLKSCSPALDHVCFTNSGAESVEAAIKLARLRTGKTRVVSLCNGFHGKTYSALSACGSDRYKLAGIYDPANYSAVEAGDLTALSALLKGDDVAAFLFEPVQGEGGMEAVDPAFLHDAIALCHKHNVVVIADEIQCGLGRCGHLIFSDAHGYDIDVLLLGKGLGGGIVAIGAVVYSKRVYTKVFEKKHSSTFAGGGFACSVALNILDILTRDRVMLSSVRQLSACVEKHVAQLHARFGDKVQVSGVGLMRAIHFSEDSGGNYLIQFMYNSGVLAYIICSYLLHRHGILAMPLMSRPCSIRFEPALTTGAVQIERFFAAMNEVSQLIDHGRYDILLAHLIDIDIGDLDLDRLERIAVGNSDHPMIDRVSTGSPDYGQFDFAFLIHITSEADFIKSFPRALHLNYTWEQQLHMARMLIDAGTIDPSPEVALSFRVNNGESCRKGILIFSPLTPKNMMKLSPRDKLHLIDEYFALAVKLGAKVVGLGAYTSVITRAGLDITNRYQNVCITTGNSLTAISTYEQFKAVYQHRPDVVTAIIGARGSVGRVVTLSVLNDVPRVILVGRSNTSIDSYRDFLVEVFERADEYKGPIRHDSVTAHIKSALEVARGEGSVVDTARIIEAICTEDLSEAKPIVLSSEVESCLRQSHYVISCTSEGKPFLDDKHLPEGAIALDAGRPFDFLISKDANAKVYEAGLVKQPHSFSYGDFNLAIAKPGVNLACLSETIILSLEGVNRHYSIGRTIDHEDVAEVKAMAEKNNYTPCLVEHGY